MKKTSVLTLLLIVIAFFSLRAQTNSIKVTSNGLVGINMASPTYQLDVAGNLRMTYSGKSIVYDGSFRPLTGSITLGSSSYYWFQLYATTAFFTYQPVIMSDEKFKTNVASLSHMKDKLKLLRPVSYTFKDETNEIKTDELVSHMQYGFLAQDIQKVFPEMVVQREDGVLGIRYTELIPVIIQVIKEQQDEIEFLKKKIGDLEKMIP
jgi:hypothetical protein